MRLRLLPILFLLLAAAAHGSARDGLAEYRTTATAQRAEIQPADVSGRLTMPAYLGVATETHRGRPVVLEVDPTGPAATADLRKGDVLLEAEGKALKSTDDLRAWLAEKRPGESIRLKVERQRSRVEIRATLGEVSRPMSEPPFRQADLTSEEQPTIQSGPRRATFDEPVYRLAVVCIEYPDVKHNPAITLEHWNEALFSKGTYSGKLSPTGQRTYGSLNDYYQEVSAGAFSVQGKVFDWVTVSRNRGDYVAPTSTLGRTALLNEALDLLLQRDGAEALKDFDGLLFLYAGSRYRANRGQLYWPHRATMTHRSKRWPYFIVPEGGPRMGDISVIAHEFGHMLGLPDLYARPENPGSEGVGNWCLMSQQVAGGRPQHMSAWCKERMGWLKPAVVDPRVPQKLVLGPINGSSTECFKVLVRPDGSEYLLLENRRKTGFDESLPAEGLLIWRVVGGRPILEESHGIEGPAGPRSYPNLVPYPSAANSSFTPYTLPSSRSQLGGGLPVHITAIRRLDDGRIAFHIGYQYE